MSPRADRDRFSRFAPLPPTPPRQPEPGVAEAADEQQLVRRTSAKDRLRGLVDEARDCGADWP